MYITSNYFVLDNAGDFLENYSWQEDFKIKIMTISEIISGL